MRFGIALPQNADQSFTPESLRTFALRAEEVGFRSAWVQELVLGKAARLSPIEAMTWAAATTSRLRLGCSLFVLPRHSAVYLAKAISTLDVLSQGRIEVGVGLGALDPPYAAFGITSEARVTRFLEYVTAMKALWTDSEATLPGRFLQLDRAHMEPKPVQRPHPPVWFGGTAPAALARAVTHADGWFGAGRSSTEEFTQHVRGIRQELDRQNRDAATLQIAKRVYVAVDDDPSRGKKRMQQALSHYYETTADLSYMAVIGTPEQCAAGLQDVANAGAGPRSRDVDVRRAGAVRAGRRGGHARAGLAWLPSGALSDTPSDHVDA